MAKDNSVAKAAAGGLAGRHCAFFALLFNSSTASLHIEEGVPATKRLITGEAVGHCIVSRSCSRIPGRVLRGGGCFLTVSRILAAATETILDFIQNDDRHALLRICLIFPCVLIVAAAQVDVRTFLQIHLADPFTEGTKGLNGQIDPSVILLGADIVDLSTDAKAHKVSLLGELQRRSVIGTFGYRDLRCKKL